MTKLTSLPNVLKLFNIAKTKRCLPSQIFPCKNSLSSEKGQCNYKGLWLSKIATLYRLGRLSMKDVSFKRPKPTALEK